MVVVGVEPVSAFCVLVTVDDDGSVGREDGELDRFSSVSSGSAVVMVGAVELVDEVDTVDVEAVVDGCGVVGLAEDESSVVKRGVVETVVHELVDSVDGGVVDGVEDGLFVVDGVVDGVSVVDGVEDRLSVVDGSGVVNGARVVLESCCDGDVTAFGGDETPLGGENGRTGGPCNGAPYIGPCAGKPAGGYGASAGRLGGNDCAGWNGGCCGGPG